MMQPNNFAKHTGIALALLCAFVLASLDAHAANQALINRPRDGSRSDAVHHIMLRDADGNVITPKDSRPQPFSTKMTCGECHNYEKIGHGWHFNNATTESLSGRGGEPWVLSDVATGTQLPVALHAWKGTWTPEKIGLSPWGFAKAFGRHMPGGGILDVDADATETMTADSRWDLSGPVEINCLACHSGSHMQDQTECAAQMASENFKWAATAASGLANVDRAVRDLPDFYDTTRFNNPDYADKGLPTVAYTAGAFDNKNQVFFNIKARPDDNRCLFCHSTSHAGEAQNMSDRDIHLAAGMNCVDCHRNGIDHAITRGGEAEAAATKDAKVMTLTCQGCHLGDEGQNLKGGRLHAPRPKHKGLPVVHLEKMTCTACHSGPEPAANTHLIKTARNHRLGARMVGEMVLPYIVGPVFVKQDGKTRPCQMIWPSFWGTMKGEEITPMLPAKVTDAVGKILQTRINDTTGTEYDLNQAKIAGALKELAKTCGAGNEVVYVAGGKVNKLSAEGTLATADNPAAEPYAWPIAHDVRGAGQALGAKGCAECHAQDAPFFSGAVEVADTLIKSKADVVKMNVFEKLPNIQNLAKLTCVECHREEEKALATGLHKPDGKSKMPTCTDCHGQMTTTFGADGFPTHGTTVKGANRSSMSVAFTSFGTHGTTVTATNRAFNQARQMVAACSSCHQGQHKELKADPVETYKENAHGKALLKKGKAQAATCADCHGSHAMLRPSDPKSTLNPQNVPKTCGRCHDGVADIFYSSIHGKTLLAGKQGAATCTSCHSSHGIGPVNKTFMVGVIKECSTCHMKQGVTYMTSYHGKATSLGRDSTAVCSSCHGSHEIMATSSTLASVAPGNLVKTCGQCHQGVNKNFVKYMPHVDMTNPKSSLPVYLVYVFMTVLLLGTMAFFVPHTLLWFQRSLVDRLRKPNGYHLKASGERRIRRFSLIHRILHAMVIVSFMGLVATGFPLKYSSTDWAKSFAAVLGGVQVMGIIHRVMAIITFAYFGIHLGFLGYFFAFKCPTSRMKFLFGPDSLIPTVRDLKDFIAMLRWFLWLGPRPKLDRWVYFEKFDYWGAFWGISVIGCSGLILWMPSLFTRWLPGWIVNCATVVHSHEALLAAGFIFLIHFFHTHVRPEKFPIDMGMLTGSTTEEEMKEEHGAYYERLADSGKLEEQVVAPVALHWRVLGALAGLAMFGIGTWLIVLAIKTEIWHFFH